MRVLSISPPVRTSSFTSWANLTGWLISPLLSVSPPSLDKISYVISVGSKEVELAGTIVIVVVVAVKQSPLCRPSRALILGVLNVASLHDRLPFVLGRHRKMLSAERHDSSGAG